MTTEPTPKLHGPKPRTWAILIAITVAVFGWGAYSQRNDERTASMSALCAEIAAADFSKVPLSGFTDRAMQSEAPGSYAVWSALNDLERAIATPGADTTDEIADVNAACSAAR